MKNGILVLLVLLTICYMPISSDAAELKDISSGDRVSTFELSISPLDLPYLQEKQFVLTSWPNQRDEESKQYLYYSIPENTTLTVRPKDGYSVSIICKQWPRIEGRTPIEYDGSRFDIERASYLQAAGLNKGKFIYGENCWITEEISFSLPEKQTDCVYALGISSVQRDTINNTVLEQGQSVGLFFRIDEDTPADEQPAEGHSDTLDRKHKMMTWIQNLKDVSENDWFYPILPGIYGLMTGVSETEFAPNQPMTRAMFATILYRLNDEAGKTTAGGKFVDVPADKWYTDAVNWAAANNIVSGVGENRFDPDSNVTREQMAVMLKNYSDYKKDTLRSGEETPPAYSSFKDVSMVSPWAAEPMKWAVENGLIKGTDIGLEPQKTATRAQVAQLMYNYIASR